MLVLSRKCGERVLISGGIVVTVVAIQGDKVRLGFEAPPEVVVLREEIADTHPRDRRAGQPEGPSPGGHPSRPEGGLGRGN